MVEPIKRYINITQDDIDKGVPNDCNRCAVALALKREYKTDDVEVLIQDGSYVLLCIGKNELNISSYMDNDVLDFIDLFDRYNKHDTDYVGREHKIPKPFTLEVIE
jgi:hypothetical protein